jgi:hypothetical protein
MQGQTTGAGPVRPHARRSRGWTGATALLAALAITQLACTNLLALPAPPLAKAVISGKVYGDRLQDQQAGKTVAVPLLATVRCNESSAQTTVDGSYRLSVSQTAQYACSASAPTYVAAQTVLVGSLGPLFHLDFGGPTVVTSCGVPALTPTVPNVTPTAATPTATRSSAAVAPTTSSGASSAPSAVLECPELHLATGTVTGVVTNADDHTPAAGTRLACWNPHGSPMADLTPNGTYQTQTDANGAFSLTGLPIDRYLCMAGGDPRPTVISPAPGATTTVSVTMCAKHCPSVTYQGGPVMHTMTVYVVFWLPSGHMYSDVGTAHFEGLIQRYFHDVGGTSYYNIATQYWDTATGFILNQVALGGVYVDTHPYPHAGTRDDPLVPSDIAAEVQAVVSARNWTRDTSHVVFVYTAYGAEMCDGGSGGLCTFPHGSQQVFCGYHSTTNDNTIFAEIADTQGCTGGAYAAPYDSPNGDRLADEALITTSHEQFESATDPDTHGWWGGDASTGEIGDKCEQSYQEVTLGGHPYWVQPEWSDRSNSCVYGM